VQVTIVGKYHHLSGFSTLFIFLSTEFDSSSNIVPITGTAISGQILSCDRVTSNIPYLAVTYEDTLLLSLSKIDPA
jgi:hypothetical protein